LLHEPQVVFRETAHPGVVGGNVPERCPGFVEAFQLELADRDVVVHGHACLAGVTSHHEVEQGGLVVAGRESLLAGCPVPGRIRDGRWRKREAQQQRCESRESAEDHAGAGNPVLSKISVDSITEEPRAG
jgi:hypothetical protein